MGARGQVRILGPENEPWALWARNEEGQFMSSLLLILPWVVASAESGLCDCWSHCELKSWGLGLQCRHHINQCQFKREDYFNLGVSLAMSQYMVHYLISRKVSLRPHFSVLICYSQTIWHTTNCKMKQSQYPKTDRGRWWRQCQWKTCIVLIIAHLAFPLWSWGWGGGGYNTEAWGSVGAGKVGPTTSILLGGALV